jgi:hypothetical protein
MSEDPPTVLFRCATLGDPQEDTAHAQILFCLLAGRFGRATWRLAGRFL